MARARRQAGSGREDGAAVVEMAVMMFIFVPLTLFMMFTSDAAFHLLDVQEAVVSTVWDFSTRGYGTDVAVEHVGQVSVYNRLEYTDHDSSFTNLSMIDEDGTTNGDGMAHHVQPFAHACWCQNGCSSEKHWNQLSPYGDGNEAVQVQCELKKGASAGDAESYSTDLTGGANHFRDQEGQGGLVQCWGKAWLSNYLIGDKFIADFPSAEKVPLFNKKRRTGNVHGSGRDATGDILLKARAGLLVDTWAIADGSGISVGRTGGNKAFYNRVREMYSFTPWFAPAVAGVAAYSLNAADKNLATILFGPSGWEQTVGAAPSPTGLFAAVRHGQALGDYKVGRHFTTPLYGDSATAFDNRGGYYLGAKDEEKR